MQLPNYPYFIVDNNRIHKIIVYQTDIVANVFKKKNRSIRYIMIVISNKSNVNDLHNNHFASNCLSKKSIDAADARRIISSFPLLISAFSATADHFPTTLEIWAAISLACFAPIPSGGN